MASPVRKKNFVRAQQTQWANLSNVVGDFIRYWGFRRIHGQLWALIYLSKDPLSGVQLVEKLGVSKGLVSKGLQELLEYQLILCEMPDGRTKCYRAVPDVFSVVQEIVKTREHVLVKEASTIFQNLAQLTSEMQEGQSQLAADRLTSLGEMIAVADGVLESLTAAETFHGLDLLRETT